MSERLTIGIMAHVDAGKTTLSEGLLYAGGVLRGMGRVDHGDAFLDTEVLEKERGITIFAKQAVLPDFTLLDTPGHVDFAPETERVLDVLDYAVLVISGTDGVQGHTRTLWHLLEEYGVPVFLFVNKMDQLGTEAEGAGTRMRDSLMRELRSSLSDGCIDFSGTPTVSCGTGGDAINTGADDEISLSGDTAEDIAVTDETVMEEYLETGGVSLQEVRRLIRERKIFPCFFGSALKNEGIKELYQGLITYASDTFFEEELSAQNFAARVYKISRDAKGTRITHIRVLSGCLKPKQMITMCSSLRTKNTGPGAAMDTEDDASKEITEKVDQIRRYSGDSFELLTEAGPGMVCALTGLRETFPGQGLGEEPDLPEPLIEPVLNYRLILPEDVAPVTLLPKLRELEEEQPELHIRWVSVADREEDEIHAQVMGEVQTEILHDLVLDRYGVDIGFGQPQIRYKETVTKAVEGIGHYESLRHYAEVHLSIEPGVPGSGIVVGTSVSTDELDLNWQRLILTHILEREHPGVRIGAPLTDVKITVIGGRAHLKHTEGGDFRQATYRAIRQGLMQASCQVLEPYYSFRMTVPQEQIGRAMTDIERRHGEIALETEVELRESGMSVLAGVAPVSTMQNYAAELAAYSGGRGTLSLELKGYLTCHDEQEVIDAAGYDPEADGENPTGSVFCAHGAGYYVQWNEVSDMAHIQTGWRPEEDDGEGGEPPETGAEPEYIRKMDEALGTEEIDSILDQAGMANRRAPRKSLRRAKEKTVRRASKPSGQAKPRRQKEKLGEFLLVDGYNVIHAWSELAELAGSDMEQARGKLQDILCNYQGYHGGEVILVFDAYRVAGHPTEMFDYHNIHVVYTKTAETADQFIEKFSVEKAERYHVTVVTNDGLEQIIIRGAGAHLLSARDFRAEMEHVQKEMSEWSPS